MDLHKIAEKSDARLSKRLGYDVETIERNLSLLLHGNSVEVGKRTSCGRLTQQSTYIVSGFLLSKKCSLAHTISQSVA